MKQQLPDILKYIFPRFQDFVFITILLLGVLLGPRFLGDGDPGRHIVIGEIILTKGYIPQTDLFSHTRTGLPLTTTEWLSEALFGAAHLIMGMNGVVLLAIFLISVTSTLVFRETARRSGSYMVAFTFVFWMITATLFHWLARPHLFSWLMVAIWTVMVDRLVRCKKKSLWQFPLMMLVWVNLHGGFVIGFLILAAYLIGWALDLFLEKEKPLSPDVIKHLSLVLISSLLVTLLNPAGLNIWSNVFGHVGDKSLMALQIDWHSPDFHSPNTWPFLLLIMAMLFTFAANKKSFGSGQILLCVGLAALALFSVRNIPFFVISALPVLGEMMLAVGILRKSNGSTTTLQQNLHGATWSVIATITVVILLLSGKSLDSTNLGNTFNPKGFPVAAVNWLEDHPQSGNLYNEFTWGGYIIYRLWPETKVFIDGQTDFYGTDLVQEYLTVLNARENWENILDKYKVEWVLVPRHSVIAERLEMNQAWFTIYDDDVAIIMRNTSP